MKFGKDETVLCSDGKEIAIRDFLGEGGQGEVYLAEYNGKQYADNDPEHLLQRKVWQIRLQDRGRPLCARRGDSISYQVYGKDR